MLDTSLWAVTWMNQVEIHELSKCMHALFYPYRLNHATDFSPIFTDRVRSTRREVIVSLCLSVHIGEGGETVPKVPNPYPRYLPPAKVHIPPGQSTYPPAKVPTPPHSQGTYPHPRYLPPCPRYLPPLHPRYLPPPPRDRTAHGVLHTLWSVCLLRLSCVEYV